jgi:glycosyltransferase involved in cell wall biosynthesis
MSRPTITAHCLIKNEENYIKYALESVLPYVDKVLIFDTGSTDSTVSMIQDLISNHPQKEKIQLVEKKMIDPNKHTEYRNEMIDKTTTDWYMVLDGDEVWPEQQIQFLLEQDLPAAEKIERKCIMVYYHLAAGDLYHYTESGQFTTTWGLHGHLTFRCFKNTQGIRWQGEYNHDLLVYEDGTEVIVQDNVLASSAYYWHLSKLPRSSKDKDVFAREKKSKLNWLPQSLKKMFYKSYTGELPDVFHGKSDLGRTT